MSRRSKQAKAARRRLRALAWCVAAVAVLAAGNGVTGPGGAPLGLILVGALAATLHATRNPTRRKTPGRKTR